MGSARRLLTIAFLIAATYVAFAGQSARAQNYGSAKLSWGVTPIITLSLTPNYQTGFGPSGGSGSGSTPAPGSGAVLNGGVIDFGNQVVQGYQYIYKYAVKAGVLTNDGGGFTLYAEGTDINDTTAGGTVPIDQILYWLPSNAGNTEFSAATAFTKTSSPTGPGCGGQCITYAGNPPASAVVWSYPTSTMGLSGQMATQGYDYQLRLGAVNNPDSFSVYITYTAVGN